MPNGKKYFCAPLPLKLFERSTHIRPRDCSDLPQGSQSGVYTICPTNETFDVYCDMNTVGFGWTVFQSRMNGTVDFFKGWCEYEIGFGNLKSEFWLGNKLINLLTSSGNYKLYIHLEDFNGNSRYAEYSEFSVGDDTANYTLKISGFSGNAGDSMMFGGSFDHNGMMFSTKDRDNDKSASIDCATDCNGGWWYNSCHGANLNGAYLGPIYSNLCNGVIWYAWKREYISLKTTKMMIKRQ
ncbi:microfibril-associated glycoprotein 4-like [Mytilus trossulus]|uniref:microfibril-associated glycoprotein 4-like n=1 Tax=Mytilus trossulus TaxID=6551 RepID=UPI003006F93B